MLPRATPQEPVNFVLPILSGFCGVQKDILYGVFSTGQLHKYVHRQGVSMYKGYVHTHEHDFVRAHGLMETVNKKKLLICCMCDQSFYEW
jgi:hypothetical protein